MSKKDVFKACLVAAVVMSASSAMAAGITGTTSIGGGTFSPSNKVTIFVEADPTNYAAKSGHSNGDRTIFTNNVDPKMVWTSKTVGSDPGTVGSATEAIDTSWTSL